MLVLRSSIIVSSRIGRVFIYLNDRYSYNNVVPLHLDIGAVTKSIWNGYKTEINSSGAERRNDETVTKIRGAMGNGGNSRHEWIRVTSGNIKRETRTIRDLDRKILDDAAEEDLEKEILEGDEYNFNLDSKIRKIRKLLLAKTSTLNANAQSFAEQSHFIQTVYLAHNFTDNSPKLDLPKFEGNVLEWHSFWDSFDSAIHSNSTLSEVQKCNYLKSLLEWEASNTIAGFALTVDLLHERFGQTQRIIQSYMQALLDMQPLEIRSQIYAIFWTALNNMLED